MPEAAARTPAERIVARFGVDRLAGWTGRHRSRVHAWTWPTSRGGTGGAIPLRLRPAIIEGVKADLGEALSYAEFEPRDGESYLMGGPQ